MVPRRAVLSPLTGDRYADAVTASPAPTPPRPDRGRTARVRLALWRVAALCYLAALAWLVLMPAKVAGQATGVVQVLARALAALGVPEHLGYPVLEFLANVALFVPFGAVAVLALPLRAPSTASTAMVIGAGALSSVAIECAQLWIPGRVSTISDVIANTLGTALGVAVTWWLRAPRRRGSAAPASAPPGQPGAHRPGTRPPSA